MYRYMKEVFGGPPGFLSWFMCQGYFLDDLVLRPVNHDTTAERRCVHCEAIPSLAKRIAEYSPVAIVTVLKMIKQPVTETISRAGSTVHHYVISFPGNGQQGKFRREMREIIPKLPTADVHDTA